MELGWGLGSMNIFLNKLPKWFWNEARFSSQLWGLYPPHHILPQQKFFFFFKGKISTPVEQKETRDGRGQMSLWTSLRCLVLKKSMLFAEFFIFCTLSESAEWRDVLSWTNPDQQRRGCDCRNEQAIMREWSISSESVMTCQSWAWGFRERDSERRYEHMDQKNFLIKKLMKEQRNSIEKEKEIQEKRHTLKKKN